MLSPRGSAPRTPQHALSRAASPARSVRVARFAALASFCERFTFASLCSLASFYERFTSLRLRSLASFYRRFTSLRLRSLASFYRRFTSLRLRSLASFCERFTFASLRSLASFLREVYLASAARLRSLRRQPCDEPATIKPLCVGQRHARTTAAPRRTSRNTRPRRAEIHRIREWAFRRS